MSKVNLIGSVLLITGTCFAQQPEPSSLPDGPHECLQLKRLRPERHRQQAIALPSQTLKRWHSLIIQTSASPTCCNLPRSRSLVKPAQENCPTCTPT